MVEDAAQLVAELKNRGLVYEQNIDNRRTRRPALNPSTAKCVSCAQAIGAEIDIAVMGAASMQLPAEAAALDSVKQVIAVDADHLAAPLAVNWAPEALRCRPTTAISWDHQPPSAGT